ncbi:MAG: hypothetical protein AAB676_20685 [Verrucomicrobiota bacterium]
MKPSTPKTELPPSTQLPKAVFGGALYLRDVAVREHPCRGEFELPLSQECG